ncbi:MAG: hypothetical protein J6T06_03990 [Victivallales bacterium]|nr:hypothetical protein [Victivallales bacterium]
MPVKLSSVRMGECFKLTNSAKAPVWLRGGYDHSSKKFNCAQYWDANHESQFKPDRIVYVGFSF